MNISLQVQPALHPLVRCLLVLVEDVEYLESRAKEGSQLENISVVCLIRILDE